MEETNRDSITNRLSQRMDFDTLGQTHFNKERPDSFYQRPTNYTSSHKMGFRGENMTSENAYLPNACQTPLPVIPKNNNQIKRNQMMPLSATDDLRKPVNYKNINKLTQEAQDHYYTKNNRKSDTINQRIQDFAPIGIARAFPVQNDRKMVLPDNKPQDTRQGPYGKYG